jgi:hypothetical protein
MLVALAGPASAQDTAPAAQDGPSVPDRLVQTSMACLPPPLPSLMLNNAETPSDMVKLGVSRLNDFAQNASVYLNCIGNKAMIAANAVYQKLLAEAQRRMNGTEADKKAPAI